MFNRAYAVFTYVYTRLFWVTRFYGFMRVSAVFICVYAWSGVFKLCLPGLHMFISPHPGFLMRAPIRLFH